MQEYRISRDEMETWCHVPVSELVGHPDSRVEMIMRDTRAEIAEYVGNFMAEEVLRNNAAGKITRWVLPSGPEDQYKTFIRRVNEERISLKNLWVFHMDEILDWQCRPYPKENKPESCEGRMLARFYGKIDPELNVPEEQRIWPRLETLDYPDQMCEKLGGIDTVFGGLGYKGLIAANEAPQDPYFRISLEEYANSKTRIIRKNVDSIIMKSERNFGGMYDRCDPFMLTVGMKILCSAEKVLFMVTTGKWKSTAIRVMMFSQPTLEYPATILTEKCGRVIIACDANTAKHPVEDKEIILSNENNGSHVK